MEPHPVSAIFPMMSPDEFAGLKSDISSRGQIEPVWTWEGKVIDGRNRLKACQELGLTPKVREWDGRGSLVEFVVSLNLHRRHLSSGQRAACGTEIEERLAVEAKERQRAAGGDRGNQHTKPKNPIQVTSELWTADQERKRRSNPVDKRDNRRVAEPVVERFPQPPPEIPKARDQAAKLVGSNPRYIQDAKAVKAAAPELHEKVKAGEITLPQAKREVARQEKREALEARAAEVAAEPVLASKPAWEIRQGDCMDLLAEIEAESVRLAFADPPYNIGIDYGDHHDDSMETEDFIEWSERWIQATANLLAPDGSMWVLINDEHADLFGVMLRDAKLHRRSWIKWYESFGVNTSNNFNRCSRHLFYCVKDPKRFVFNPDAVSRPSDRQVKYGDSRADPGGKIWDNVWGLNPPIPRLVENAKERIPDFPTQLPLQLLMAVVGCASEPGDLVLDPFNGSGTTGEASIRLGRRYIGFEKSEKFAALSRLRLTAANGVHK